MEFSCSENRRYAGDRQWKKLIFIEMPMLHWPDSMATYLTEDNILFSNDAFGQHYAIEELFNDKADQCVMMKEAMKYYANILNPYAPMLIRKLKEIESFHLPIDMICPSHGAIWRKEPSQIIEKYAEWANAYQRRSSDDRLRHDVERHRKDRA